MKWFSAAMQSARRAILATENRRRLRLGLGRMRCDKATPIFFIFTRDIVHFAPYCIPQNVDGFEPVLVLNSVSVADEKWLHSLYPDRVIVSLKVSMTGNEMSMLSHGDVLNDLFAISNKPFCIQDPDCFVTAPSFWRAVKLDSEKYFACGPFTKSPTDHVHVLPDTFFLMLNPCIFKKVCRRFRISATSVSNLLPAAQEKIRQLGYKPGQYPEQFKGYFDTLQAFWLLALAEGYQFKQIPGVGESIFHIGGTSYLHSSDYDLAHWDYWPLSVIYFNLRLLELPAGERFREQFREIFDRFESSDHLLISFPTFSDSRRFKEMQILLSHMVN